MTMDRTSPENDLSDFMKSVRAGVKTPSEPLTSGGQRAAPTDVVTDSHASTSSPASTSSSASVPPRFRRSTISSLSHSGSSGESPPLASTSPRPTPSVLSRIPVTRELEEGEVLPGSQEEDEVFPGSQEEGELLPGNQDSGPPAFTNPFNGKPIVNGDEYAEAYISEKSRGKRRATDGDSDDKGMFMEVDGSEEVEEGQLVEDHVQAQQSVLPVKPHSQPLVPPKPPTPPAAPPVPGLWFARAGEPYSDIIEGNFTVDETIHQRILRWSNRKKPTSRSVHHLLYPSTQLKAKPVQPK